MSDIMLWTQLLVTCTLVGFIWTVQLVHYPAFRYIDHDQFAKFHAMHTLGITWIVAPLMLVELGTACVWLWHERTWQIGAVLGLVMAVWLVTFIYSVSCHNRLQYGKDDAFIQKLIHTNWARTILWTLKALLLGAIGL